MQSFLSDDEKVANCEKNERSPGILLVLVCFCRYKQFVIIALFAIELR